MVSASRFKDDLNFFIQRPEYTVQLRSVLNELLAGRVVDQIEDMSPRSRQKADPKQQALFRQIAREASCALYVKEVDAPAWFGRYGTFKRGCLTVREFQTGLEQLDALQVIENPQAAVQSYYEALIKRQTLGYDESLLLVD